MGATSMLHVRLDDELKAQATEALSAMGLTTTEAVRLLFHRIVAEQAFPIELKVPNAETRAAMEEARRTLAEGKLRYRDADAMMSDLEKAGSD